MSSEGDARTMPEPVETPDGDLAGKAWFHNKFILFGGIGAVAAFTGVIVYLTAERAQAPPAAPAPKDAIENIRVTGGGRDSSTLAPESPIANRTELLADDLFTPPSLNLQDLANPDPPEEEEEPELPPISDPDQQTTAQDLLFTPDDAPNPYQSGEEVLSIDEQRQRDWRRDSLTAPTTPAGNLWGAYWASAAELEQEMAEEEEALEAAAMIAAIPETESALWEGTIIHARIPRAFRSDANLPLTALVTRDVLDDLDGRRVAIPRGSTLVGSHTGITWNRIQGNWRAVILPDGRNIPLVAAIADGAEGQGGVKGKLRTGSIRRLALGTTASVIGAIGRAGSDDVQLVQVPTTGQPSQASDLPPDDPNTEGPTTNEQGDLNARFIAVESPESRATREVTQDINDMVQTEVEMMMNRQRPYVKVEPGSEVLAVLQQDLRF